MSRYWKRQADSLTAIALPDPEELFQELELQRPWEPILSGALQAKLNLGVLGQLGGGTLPDLESSSGQSSVSGLTNPGSIPGLDA